MAGKLKICSVCSRPAKLWKSIPPIGICCHSTYAAKQSIERHRGVFEHKGLVQTSDGEEAKPFKVGYQTKRIKSVSTRMQKIKAIYNTAAKLFKKNNPVCKARIKCIGSPTTDVHHKKGRGEYLLDENTWLPVCRECHNWIEQHPEQAKDLGLSESRLSKAI